MLKQDNIPITHLTNTATGVNDLVMIVFDMRQFQAGNNARLLLTLSRCIKSNNNPRLCLYRQNQMMGAREVVSWYGRLIVIISKTNNQMVL